jgi:acyl-coenzyme A synthetase/AMP-(fatty) acid ligase
MEEWTNLADYQALYEHSIKDLEGFWGELAEKSIAYIYEMPELGISQKITYSELFDLVKKYSASLRACGITKGDRVLLYLPTTIEAIVMLQACARIGAISTTVFAGFAPRAIADRIEATKPKLSLSRREKDTAATCTEDVPPYYMMESQIILRPIFGGR